MAVILGRPFAFGMQECILALVYGSLGQAELEFESLLV